MLTLHVAILSMSMNNDVHFCVIKVLHAY